ncbi:complement regulator-acquiring protein [Borreliella bavariensis]|uniref:complement regulator-acquiring protein n=1 Tax=Borreliella bavariensis TaxID=664662 RepID=UPI001E32E13E|nr:complement regulator-acquiring protein [Borreliella bavariensis]
MKRNMIYKILTLFKITLLFSCSFYSPSNSEEATKELQSNLIAKNFSINKAENLNNLQQSQLSKTKKERIIKKFIQRLNENEELIESIESKIEISTQKTNQDIQKIEPIDHFGINKNAFPENTGASNIDLMLKKNEARRLFYSSLDYDENKIKKLISILAKTSSSSGYHYNIIDAFFWKGFKTQESLETVVNLLTKNELRRLILNFETKTVKDIQEKFEKLIQNKNAWIKIVEEVISKYGNNTASSSVDRIILGEMIRLGYEYKLNPDESMRITEKMKILLKACCDHIHY